jgi:hypothetical protein
VVNEDADGGSSKSGGSKLSSGRPLYAQLELFALLGVVTVGKGRGAKPR